MRWLMVLMRRLSRVCFECGAGVVAELLGRLCYYGSDADFECVYFGLYWVGVVVGSGDF